MGTELFIERSWTASKRTVVILRKGVAYVRFNDSRENALQTGQKYTLEEGDRIVSLLGCTVEIEDVEGE
jgi:hypothetical protein